jgi:hypothetical protein
MAASMRYRMSSRGGRLRGKGQRAAETGDRLVPRCAWRRLGVPRDA